MYFNFTPNQKWCYRMFQKSSFFLEFRVDSKLCHVNWDFGMKGEFSSLAFFIYIILNAAFQTSCHVMISRRRRRSGVFGTSIKSSWPVLFKLNFTYLQWHHLGYGTEVPGHVLTLHYNNSYASIPNKLGVK